MQQELVVLGVLGEQKVQAQVVNVDQVEMAEQDVVAEHREQVEAKEPEVVVATVLLALLHRVVLSAQLKRPLSSAFWYTKGFSCEKLCAL